MILRIIISIMPVLVFCSVYLVGICCILKYDTYQYNKEQKKIRERRDSNCIPYDPKVLDFSMRSITYKEVE